MMFQKVLLAATLCVLLTACDWRNSLGLDHYQPDEFKVLDHPPLSMPKDYALRPPRTGSETSSAQTNANQAKKTLGVSESSVASSKTGEAALLTQATGKTVPDTDVRQKIDKEAAVDTNVSEALSQKLTSWKEEFSKNVSSINSEAPPSENK